MTTSQFPSRLSRATLAMLLAWAFFSSGCGLKQVTFERDAGVTRLFEQGSVLPDHDYYYSGPEAEPLAIVGIRPGYTFEQGLWKKVALSEEQLKAWVWRIDTMTRSTRFHYYGAHIVGPEGDEVGVWYSFLDWVVAEVTPERRVILHTPDNTVIPGMHRQRGLFQTGDPP